MIREIVTHETAVQQVEKTLAETSPRSLQSADTMRWGAAEDVRQLRALQPGLPQLPEVQAHLVYEKIVDAEGRIVGASRALENYDRGTAKYPDELLVEGQGTVISEAQHATNPFRRKTGVREAADHGIGGLALVLSQRQSVRTIIPLGDQQGNANVSVEHPIKNELIRQLDPTAHVGFLSVHGCFPGKVTAPTDTTEVHAIIGLGQQPNDASWSVAEAIAENARERYGLRVIIGNQQPHFNYAKAKTNSTAMFRDRTTKLERDEQGNLKPSALAALGAASTTNFMSRYAKELAQEHPMLSNFPSLQIEMSRSLRLMPADAYRRKDPSAEVMGVYLGYCLGSLAVEMCQQARLADLT